MFLPPKYDFDGNLAWNIRNIGLRRVSLANPQDSVHAAKDEDTDFLHQYLEEAETVEFFVEMECDRPNTYGRSWEDFTVLTGEWDRWYILMFYKRNPVHLA